MPCVDVSDASRVTKNRESLMKPALSYDCTFPQRQRDGSAGISCHASSTTYIIQLRPSLSWTIGMVRLDL